MDLTLSKDSFTNTTLFDHRKRPVYKVFTPIVTLNPFKAKTTTISRFDSGDPDEEQYSERATIDWHSTRPSKLLFNGGVSDIGRFLRGTGYVNGDRTFAAPDGRSYRWYLWRKRNGLELVSNDASEVKIALFEESPDVKSRQKARFEIYPAGMHMVDLIIVTFVCLEWERRDIVDARIEQAAQYRHPGRNGAMMAMNQANASNQLLLGQTNQQVIAMSSMNMGGGSMGMC